MGNKKVLLNLLQEAEEGRSPKCYTCNHPIARDLIKQLVVALRAEQKEGRMQGYTGAALLRAVAGECQRQDNPFAASADAFRNHVRNHIVDE